MNTLSKILIAVLVLVVGASVAFLASWDMPPPSEKVEKVIPNDRVLR